MRTGRGHAHGKIILIGEHAVVYNSRAISLPFFSTSVKVKVEDSSYLEIKSNIYSGKLESSPKSLEAVFSLINELIDYFKLPPLLFTVESNIPISAGMGSSAAIASATTQAIYDYLDLELSLEDRLKWISLSEQIAHGNPSGIDALTTTLDNAWVYKRGEEPIKFDSKLDAYLIVGQTGEVGNTKEAVSRVRKVVQDFGRLDLIEDLAYSVESCIQHYQNQDAKSVGKSLNRAQTILKQLNVSTEKIDYMVDLAQTAGALGAKLTGGGLGGCVIALVKDLEIAEKIKKQWEEFTKLETWILNLNEG